MQALPPKYVRRIHLTNKFGDLSQVVHVTVQFQDHTATYTLGNGETIAVEHEIDHGDWKAVDPILNITVRTGDENGAVLGEQAFSSDAGVKIHNVTLIHDGEGNLKFEIFDA